MHGVSLISVLVFGVIKNRFGHFTLRDVNMTSDEIYLRHNFYSDDIIIFFC